MTKRFLISVNAVWLLAITTVIVFSQAGGPLEPPAPGTTTTEVGPSAPLTPGNDPQATMKTFHQVEPRTPIGVDTTPGDATSVYLIDEPGSYYLTGDVTGESGKYGIAIDSSGVTVDLNGFSLIGVGGSLNGVVVITAAPVHEGVCVKNGVVRDWDGSGIGAGNGVAMIVRDIRSSDNGNFGIQTGYGGVHEDCAVEGSGGRGIRGRASVIRNCSAIDNGTTDTDGVLGEFGSVISGCSQENALKIGIRLAGGGVIVDCSSSGSENGYRIQEGSVIANSSANGNEWGILNTASGGEVVAGCTARGNTTSGIRTDSPALVVDNTASNNVNGIEVRSNAFVLRNHAASNADGIATTGSSANGRYEKNTTASNSAIHLNIAGGANIVISNISLGSGTAHSFSAGTYYGFAVAAGAPIGSGNEQNSWANLSY